MSGSNSGHSMSDTLHEDFYIEIKDGKQSLPTKLWVDTVQKAKHESKIPMLIQHGKQEKLMDARITLKLSDFLTLTGISESEETTIDPDDNMVNRHNIRIPESWLESAKRINFMNTPRHIKEKNSDDE